MRIWGGILDFSATESKARCCNWEDQFLPETHGERWRAKGTEHRGMWPGQSREAQAGSAARRGRIMMSKLCLEFQTCNVCRRIAQPPTRTGHKVTVLRSILLDAEAPGASECNSSIMVSPGSRGWKQGRNTAELVKGINEPLHGDVKWIFKSSVNWVTL